MKLGSTEAGRRGRSAAPMAEINIIPLVDVTLVLLIIFMATTAFVNDAGLKLTLPAAKTAEAPPMENQDLNVALTGDDKLYLNGQPITLDALRATMTQRAARNADTRVMIKGDQDIAYKRVVEIMDVAKQSGLERVVLSTDPQTSTSTTAG